MDGKNVKFEKLQYNLNELFENTPVFREPVIRFQDARVNPDDDCILTTKMMRSGFDMREFNRQADRYNKETKEETNKDYWEEMAQFVMNKDTRKKVIQRKNEYIALHELDRLKRTNLPF
jgi:hypothetical protein